MVWCRGWTWVLLGWCSLTCHAIRVDSRTGKIGITSRNDGRSNIVYAPRPVTEAPLNPRPGFYQVTEVTQDYTTRTVPRIKCDKWSHNGTLVHKDLELPNFALVIHQLALRKLYFDPRASQTGNSALARIAEYARRRFDTTEQPTVQNIIPDTVYQKQLNSLSYHRGITKKGFRNYVNRNQWAGSKQYYGLNDPKLQAGYHDFTRHYNDFTSSNGWLFVK